MSIMYELKPIINHDNFMEKPKCMYEMKNLHGDEKSRQECRIVSNVTKQAPLPEVVALEKRQEKILESLAELKNQVSNLCDVLKDKKETVTCKKVEKKIREPVSADLTLNVNPKKPCYSIFALEKLWNDVDFPIKCYVSSDLKEPVKNIYKNTEPTGKPSVINLSLIWKQNVIDSCLIVSGIQSFPIMGEINILRYFSRFLGDNYESNLTEAINVDTILDISHKIIYEDNQKNINNYFSILSKKLGKNNFFSGDNCPGIADVGLWSSIKQVEPKLPENIDNWFKKCEKYFL